MGRPRLAASRAFFLYLHFCLANWCSNESASPKAFRVNGRVRSWIMFGELRETHVRGHCCLDLLAIAFCFESQGLWETLE